MHSLSSEDRRSSRLRRASQIQVEGEEGVAKFTVAALGGLGRRTGGRTPTRAARGVSRTAAAFSLGARADVGVDLPEFVARLVEQPVVIADVQGAQISVAGLIQPPGTVERIGQRFVSAEVARVFGDAPAEA